MFEAASIRDWRHPVVDPDGDKISRVQWLRIGVGPGQKCPSFLEATAQFLLPEVEETPKVITYLLDVDLLEAGF